MSEVLDLSEINLSSLEPEGAATPPLSPLNIRVTCNTRGDKTRENVRANKDKGHTVVTVLPENDRVAVIVGGGPSLAENWTELFYWLSRGADVFALNGAAKFLNERGLLPRYQLIVDPREKNTGLIGYAQEHFIASQCDPSMFDAADNPVMVHMISSCTVEDTEATAKEGKTVLKPFVDGTLIGGDVTVGLVGMCLVHTLGFREIHLYGYDSSHEEGKHHAYDQEQTGQEKKVLEVFAKDQSGTMKKFTTNFAMAKQAELFPKTAEILCGAGSKIMVHGSGLLPTIAHSMRSQAQAAE